MFQNGFFIEAGAADCSLSVTLPFEDKLNWTGRNHALDRQKLCFGQVEIMLWAGRNHALDRQKLCSGQVEIMLWTGRNHALDRQKSCSGQVEIMLWTGRNHALDRQKSCFGQVEIMLLTGICKHCIFFFNLIPLGQGWGATPDMREKK